MNPLLRGYGAMTFIIPTNSLHSCEGHVLLKNSAICYATLDSQRKLEKGKHAVQNLAARRVVA